MSKITVVFTVQQYRYESSLKYADRNLFVSQHTL
jgi:hypothetical protein